MSTAIDALLDTSILVDILRGQVAVAGWMNSQKGVAFALPVLTAMEMMQGCQNSTDLTHVRRVMRPFPVVHLTPTDTTWAQQQHEAFWLSHGIGMNDTLIAAPAARLNLPIYTLNLKHFAPLPDIKAIRPY